MKCHSAATCETGESITGCAKKDAVILEPRDDADILTDYAVEIRYPDDALQLEAADAEQAVAVARVVYEYVMSRVS